VVLTDAQCSKFSIATHRKANDRVQVLSKWQLWLPVTPNNSGSFATFTAMRRASSKVSTFGHCYSLRRRKAANDPAYRADDAVDIA
jgi:hypothetical protein